MTMTIVENSILDSTKIINILDSTKLTYTYRKKIVILMLTHRDTVKVWLGSYVF